MFNDVLIVIGSIIDFNVCGRYSFSLSSFSGLIISYNELLDTFKGKVIAIIHRLNDNDDKLVVVPENVNYTNDQIKALTEFQEKYFESVIWR